MSGITTADSIATYKERCKKEAESIVNDIFPVKVVELNELLESDRFKIERLSALNVRINIPVPDGILLNNDVTPYAFVASAAKRRRVDMSDDCLCGSKVTVFPGGVVTCSEQITELVDIVKPYIRELLDQSNKIKMWISYLIPKIEDGNNFGVSIQEEILAETRQVESEVATYLDQISRYYLTRAKIVSKVVKYPHIDDYRRTIVELDEKEFINIRLVLCELRNHYASLHDMITKNFDKIIKPRNANTENMY